MAKDANMNSPTTGTDRWKVLGFRPPSGDAVEPKEPILLEYDSGGQVAILTLNRPHAGNGITTEMGKRMVEILRELAARPAVRCIIITGAGKRGVLGRLRLAPAQQYDERAVDAAA
jgi:enoyl-CoA hydratase